MNEIPTVLHVVTGLDAGGAEMLLVQLLERLGANRAGHGVVALTGRGHLAERIESLGVPLTSLGMNGSPGPVEISRLAGALREPAPDVIQTWMLHSNVLGGLTARAVTRAPVVWGVHLTTANRETLGAKAVVIQRGEAAISWFVPKRIVACSVSSREVMERMRYRQSRIVTILNGFDTDRFRPDPAAREEVRAELGIGPETTAIGHVARFHPIKGHDTLLAAATRVIEGTPDVRFVLVGEHVERSNPQIRELTEPLGDRVLTLGQRDDIPRLLNGFDLTVSSSSAEALPLAIGEAMATGVPVTATRCGDSEELIGDTGETAPVNDPLALAEAIGHLVERGPEGRAELGRRARERISTEYALDTMVERYRAVWSEVAS